MARRRTKQRHGPPSHTAATSPPPIDYMASLPPELARHMLPFIHPKALANLIRTNARLRKLFRLADMDVEFAMEHLLESFPKLRAVVRSNEHGQNGSDDSPPPESDGPSRKDCEAAYRQLRDKVPFGKLPLCYALAVLKIDNFGRLSVQTLSRQKIGDESDEGSWTEPDFFHMLAWFERLLLVAVCELEIGFITTEEMTYSYKEACDTVQKLVPLVDSVEIVRRIVDIERNSFQPLPSVDIEKVNDARNQFFTRIIQRLALAACRTGVGAQSVLLYLLETYPAIFSSMAEYRTRGLRETYLLQAFRTGNTATFSLLLDFMKRPPYCGTTIAGQPSPVNGESNVPFLATATLAKDEDMVRFLLDCGADPNFVAPGPSIYVNALSAAGFKRALHLACLRSSPAIIELLVAHGADPFAQEQRDSMSFNALRTCLTQEAVSALLKAVKRHMPQKLNDLLTAECDGYTVLQWDIFARNTDRARVFLEAIGMVDDDNGGLALKKAIFGTRGRFKDTVLYRACKVGEDISMMVLGAMFDGAHPATFNEMRKVLLIDDGFRRTPVHVAAENGHIKSLRKMLEVLSAVNDGMREEVLRLKMLLDKRTPLHLAALKGELSCARLLLENGADREEKDKDDLTPLMIAEREKHASVVRLLRLKTSNASQELSTGGRYELRSRVSLEPVRGESRGKKDKSKGTRSRRL
ncbi:hypothetical protein HDU96_003973 [Phlyctochytrium bullatum]|nr:hypothetical protein HDU96_003973 [Phlyctochytrium bullatum]